MQVLTGINQHRNGVSVRHLSYRIYRRNSSKLMRNIGLGSAIATYIPAIHRQRAARIINVAIHIFQWVCRVVANQCSAVLKGSP